MAHFTLPDGDIFELSDDWLSEARMAELSVTMRTFMPETPDNGTDLLTVPTSDIIPPKRSPGIVGLKKDRALSIMQCFVAGVSLPRVQVFSAGDRWEVHDGFHRYHLSVAAGFTQLPISVLERW